MTSIRPSILAAVLCAAAAIAVPVRAADRPELSAFPFKTPVAAAGSYAADAAGTDFVISGVISGNLGFSGAELFRVTLSNATVAGTLTFAGDAQLWLVGDNAVASSAASAVAASAALSIGGPGTLSASAPGGKKVGVVSAVDLTLAGGETTLTIANPTAKNACGVSLSGNYAQFAGTLAIVGGSEDVKQNGVFLSKKKTTATISGGTLDVTLGGEKSVGLALDKDTCAADISGGVLRFAMSGDGAKGVKGDGAISMTGGLLEATLSGGAAEDCYTTGDDDGNDVYYYVTLTSSTKTSGGTSTYNTTRLIAAGTYPVMDPSTCYAIKGGTVAISGGTVRARATGTAGRGIGGGSLAISGGVIDIAVAGGPTDVFVEILDETALTTCLDSGSAACLKTSGSGSVMTLSGGTYLLSATGTAGKLVNAAGSLVIGTEGAATLPTDASFSPDISGSTTGGKVFCTALKQKYYGSLATAVATNSLDGLTLSVAADNLVTGSSSSGGMGGPGGGGDDCDYSNPKGVKAETGVAVHSGRLRVTTANDGGEGFESKADMTIDGGLVELVCADDCINTASNLTVNGGYVYAGSTGNDAIDSNAGIDINGGIVLAFTATTPECGIDADAASCVRFNGGFIFTAGSATDMAYGSSGTQKAYRSTSASASTYAGKYVSLAGNRTVTARYPAMSSSSGSISLVASVPGYASGAPTASATAPSSGDTGFHGVYIPLWSATETHSATYTTADSLWFNTEAALSATAVSIAYSPDNGATWHSADLTPNPEWTSSAHGRWWHAELPASALAAGTLQYAVCVTDASGNTLWDNNDGSNYTVVIAE